MSSDRIKSVIERYGSNVWLEKEETTAVLSIRVKRETLEKLDDVAEVFGISRSRTAADLLAAAILDTLDLMRKEGK